MSYINASNTGRLISEGKIGIYPYIDKYQGPNMYYCHLGNRLLTPRTKLADTKKLSKDLYVEKTINNYYDLRPGEFILAETFEQFMTTTSYAIRLFNSSSLARLGVQQCALGMINPGCGITRPIRLTLEIVNSGPYTVRLYPTTQRKDGSVEDWGTEVLKVAPIKYDKTLIEYEKWEGSLYGRDDHVQGSLIDRRYEDEDDANS